MVRNNIKILNLKENEHLELKKSISELKEGIKSITAILNKHGKGEIYFGVKNNGEIIKQDISERTLRNISRTISENIEPKIFPEIEKLGEDSHEYIHISFEGTETPYFAYGRGYIRVADEDRQLSAKKLKEMIIKKEIYKSSWDSEPSELNINHIEEHVLKSFVDKASLSGRLPKTKSSVNNILKKLKLEKNNRLTLAAKYLFTNKHNLEVQTAVFAGNNKITFLDIKKHIGNLFFLLEQSENYVKEKMNWKVEFKNFKRKEIPEIPLRALREALVNSLIHRDFNNPKGNEIAVYKNRVEIYNPGTFPEGLTPLDFIKNEEHSYLRNPLIAEMFYLTKFVEKWGSGLKRIHEECKENNVKVEFKIIKTGVVTVFYRNRSTSEKTKYSKKEIGTKTVGKTVEIILTLIKNKPQITIKEISSHTGLTRRGVEWNIDKLKKERKLKRIGPARGGHWEITEYE